MVWTNSVQRLAARCCFLVCIQLAPHSPGINTVSGAGPTGLILSQLLKQNGAAKVVIAANKGMKMDIARQLDAADEYIELDRKNPEAQWAKLKEDYKHGFDIVVRDFLQFWLAYSVS
jgi:threonine dehydrogenase-like Zn-dependent dehydrogenase